MRLPSNFVYVTGQGSVSGENLNSLAQWCDTAADLRAFTGSGNMTVVLLGITAENDGLGGIFYWNPAGTTPDDNLDFIQPNGTTLGEWTRLDLQGESQPTQAVFNSDIPFRFDGGGSVPSIGVIGDGRVSWAGTITGWTLIPDQTGSMVLDIWKKPFATNTWPTIANTITASALPTISAGGSTAGSPTGWTTAIAAGDCFRFNLNSIATITRFTLILSVSRTVALS